MSSACFGHFLYRYYPTLSGLLPVEEPAEDRRWYGVGKGVDLVATFVDTGIVLGGILVGQNTVGLHLTDDPAFVAEHHADGFLRKGMVVGLGEVGGQTADDAVHALDVVLDLAAEGLQKSSLSGLDDSGGDELVEQFQVFALQDDEATAKVVDDHDAFAEIEACPAAEVG